MHHRSKVPSPVDLNIGSVATRWTMGKQSSQSVRQEQSAMLAPPAQRLTILVAPLDAVGHVNACSGITVNLLKRGHRVVFFVDESFRGKLSPLGFEEYYYRSYPNYTDHTGSGSKPGQKMAELLYKYKVFGPYSPKEKVQNMIKMMFADTDKFLYRDKRLKEAIEKIKPDLIYVDNIALMPAIAYSGKPWIKNISTTPLFYVDEHDLPPAGSGYPYKANHELWKTFDDARGILIYSKQFNDLVEQMGYPRYPQDRMMPETQLMTVHAYPEELNYPQIRRKGWFNLEVFNKNATKETVDLTMLASAQFLADTLEGQFSGKLIYLSMGSIGTVDLTMMTRLVSILSMTNHKYIVSKGARHAEYDLPRNMWGEEYLPQTKLIPLVDLVITHGGNNTVTETFAQGKPMIVLPLFNDQYDNAQRLTETGFGIRLDPYHLTSEEMQNAIDRLVNDDRVKCALHQAAKRIQTLDTHQVFCDQLERRLCSGIAVDQSNR